MLQTDCRYNMLLQRGVRLAAAAISRPRPYYTGPVVPLQQIKEELAGLGGGGSVDLVKDDKTGIARLTLNSSKSCNALSGSMMVQLADVIEELSTGGWSAGRGLILSAAKNSANIFCAGGDLATVRQLGTHEQGFKMAVMMNHVTRQLCSLPLLTVALLDGSAVGGGAELVSCADHRLVTPESHVTFVQARVSRKRTGTCLPSAANLVCIPVLYLKRNISNTKRTKI